MNFKDKSVAVKTFHKDFDLEALNMLRQEIRTLRAINSEYGHAFTYTDI